MRCFLDFGTAATGLVIGDLSTYAALLSNGTAADFTGATLTEVDATNLPGLYIIDAAAIVAAARGKVWVTATPAVWSRFDTARVDALIEDSSGDRFTAKALETLSAGDVPVKLGNYVHEGTVILGDGAHGGASSTFTTAAGFIAQEEVAGTMDSRVALLSDRVAFTSDLIASDFQTFDWATDAVFTAVYSETIPAGMELVIYIKGSNGTDYNVGTLNDAGFTQDPTSNSSGRAGVLHVHPGTNGGQLFPAGTLTVTSDLGYNFTGPREVSVAFPAFTGNTLHFVWDRYGVATLSKVGRYAIETAGGGGGGGIY